jgi:hypothetical protein
MVVREYAHKRTPGNTPQMRRDFIDTVFWHPVLVLPGGKTEVSFELCDSVTSFEAIAFAHSLDGRLGAARRIIESRLPFAVQPKVPLEVTASDRIDVPLSTFNNTNEQRLVQLDLKQDINLKRLSGLARQQFALPADASVRKLYRFAPTIKEGEAVLAFEGKTEPFSADAVERKIKVVPDGFPIVQAFSDVLEGSASHTVELPEKWVKGTLTVQATVYPSTLANLQKGLESLLREPNGCFEQTSTANYPNLLILDYLTSTRQTKPEVEKRAREMLARGYQKLTSFECIEPADTNPKRQRGEARRAGYEWFGGTAPAHEALTAYGLMQFRDMARVGDVDPAMLKRTRDYLMKQRDGKGGFKRNPRALDTFGRAPDHITNAYIVWALTQGGKDDDVTLELSTLRKQAEKSKDPYFLALVANALINRGQTKQALALLETVSSVQKADGHLDAEKTSITGSGGRDLQIETTSLAVLGWLKANPGKFNDSIQKAIGWIGKQRGGYGGFGSTQSTILALKALIAYTKAHEKTAEGGELKLYLEEKEAARLPFAARVTEPLVLPLPEADRHLKGGKNRLRLEITGKNSFAYTLRVSYHTLKPASAVGCPVRLSTALARVKAREGDAVRLTARVDNVSGAGQGMAVAVIGLPGGLTIPEDLKQLKDYTRLEAGKKRPLVSAFEIRGRELVLYWRDLAPEEKIEVPIDLVCRVPGEYSGPASRAYLYYNADRKHWVEPLKVTITAREAAGR